MLFLGGSDAVAAVTSLQTQSIAPTIPNWGPATPSLQGKDPLVFSQFNPSLGQLQSVNVTMNYTTSEVVNMNFTTAATITLRSASSATPNQGAMIVLNGPIPNTNLITASAPVFSYTKTYGGPGQSLPQAFSNDPSKVQPGSPFFLTPDGQPNNLTSTFTGSQTVTVSDPNQLALFTGTGTVGLPAFAAAGSSFTTTSGNGSGSIITYAGVTVSLSYTYVVPEPSSMALLGLGGGGVLLAGRLRRRRAAI